MRLTLTKMDLQHLILWASHSKEQAESVGVPFEPDEIGLMRKLYTARDRAYRLSADVTAEWQTELAAAPPGRLALAKAALEVK